MKFKTHFYWRYTQWNSEQKFSLCTQSKNNCYFWSTPTQIFITYMCSSRIFVWEYKSGMYIIPNFAGIFSVHLNEILSVNRPTLIFTNFNNLINLIIRQCFCCVLWYFDCQDHHRFGKNWYYFLYDFSSANFILVFLTIYIIHQHFICFDIYLYYK